MSPPATGLRVSRSLLSPESAIQKFPDESKTRLLGSLRLVEGFTQETKSGSPTTRVALWLLLKP